MHDDPKEELKRRRRFFAQVPVGIAIFHGMDFIAEMANEAYLSIIGQEQAEFIGRGLFESLPEVEPAVRPLLEGVMKTGIPYHGFEFEVPLHRRGRTDIAYFNFVYQPVTEDDGSITGVMVVANEVTAQVERKHFLEESERRFRGLVMNSPFALAIFEGYDLTVQIANRRMLEIWRRSFEEVKGRRLLEIFPELADQGYIEQLRGVLQSGITFRARESEAIVDAADGRKTYYVDYEYAPLFHPDGSPSGVIASVYDVTEMVVARRRIEEAEERSRRLADELELKVRERTRELEQVNAALEIKNQELTSFAYISSHDLQEPLRKIQIFSSRIMETEPELSATNRQYFTRIQAAAGRMQALIKDLLTYSRANETENVFVLKDLNEILEEIRRDTIEHAGKEVDIVVDRLPILRIIPFQFHQLFTNLFSNAIKFGKKDSPVRIEVRYSRSGNEHIFTVSDNGIGFSPEYSQRIFQVFQRLHSKNEYEGTGIGLSICKKIVENHGGTIVARGEPGQGASFIIQIPERS